jgi:hypothetical protein
VKQAVHGLYNVKKQAQGYPIFPAAPMTYRASMRIVGQFFSKFEALVCFPGAVMGLLGDFRNIDWRQMGGFPPISDSADFYGICKKPCNIIGLNRF